MNDQDSPDIQKSKSIEELFQFENHVVSTRTADLFAALGKLNGVDTYVWRLRHPLPLNSEAIQRFGARMEHIRAITPPVAIITDFGVDSEGIAFAVIPSLTGQMVTQGKLDLQEAERRFISVLRIAAAVHDAGLVFGDISDGTFWVNRRGDVVCAGIMGSFDSEATETAVLPPQETLSYIAPEQKAGGGIEPATDVYALGVLGYKLFTKNTPYQQNSGGLLGGDSPKSPREFGVELPPWADQILTQCVQQAPEARFNSAAELIQAIQESRNNPLGNKQSQSSKLQGFGANTSPPPPNSAQSGATKARSASTVHAPLVVEKEDEDGEEESGKKSKKKSKSLVLNRPLQVGITMGAVFLVVVVVGMLLRKEDAPPPPPTKLQSELRAHLPAVGDEQTKQAIRDISDPEKALKDKEAQLEKLVNSDDPLQHAILVQAAVDATNNEERALAEKAIINRSQRLGLRRSAEQVRQWLRSKGGADMPPGYSAILKSVDATLPNDAHAQILKEAYPSNPRIVLRLTAALALDTAKFGDYQKILGDLLSDTMGQDALRDHATVSLILASSELNIVFSEDAIQFKDQIPSSDLLWLLKILAERGDAHVRTVATLALERDMLSPLRRIFASLITTRASLPSDVLASLIRATAGTANQNDVVTFGKWYDPDSEKVLLALCADGYPVEFRGEIFETLLGKSLTIEPAASLSTVIQKYFWEHRGQMAKAVGVVANISVLPPQEVLDGLNSLGVWGGDAKIIKVLLNSQNMTIIRYVLDKYPNAVSLGPLLDLLESPDKDIRLISVHLLGSYNDVGALKLIIDHYEKERDPEVKKLYEQTFWVIKQRTSKP